MEERWAEAFYNAAGVTEETRPFSARSRTVFERIAPFLPDLRGKKVLELGCGNGRFSFFLEELGALPVGVDLAGDLIDFARNFAREIGSAARFYRADACDPGLSERFDFVLLLQNNLTEFSREEFVRMSDGAAGLLEPDGRFLLEWKPSEGAYREIRTSFEIPGKGRFCYLAHDWPLKEVEAVLQGRFGPLDLREREGRIFLSAPLAPAREMK